MHTQRKIIWTNRHGCFYEKRYLCYGIAYQILHIKYYIIPCTIMDFITVLKISTFHPATINGVGMKE